MEENIQLPLTSEENYQKGIEIWIKEGFEKSLNYFKQSAEQGNVFAAVCLAYLYEDNKLGEEETAIYKSKVNAATIKWLTQETNKENIDAQLCLGMCYMVGLIVGKDENQGRKYYEKAAMQGSVVAQFLLAHSYYIIGILKERDFPEEAEHAYKEAVQWYQLAAEAGMSRAQTRLAQCYEYGRGIQQNINKAVHYYNLAAQQGEAYALGRLADYYSDPQNPNSDLVKGLNFFEPAKEKGHEYAELGKIKAVNTIFTNMPF